MRGPLPLQLTAQPTAGPARGCRCCRLSCRAILVAERVALNFLQRMSGVASLTRRMVDAVQVRPGSVCF